MHVQQAFPIVIDEDFVRHTAGQAVRQPGEAIEQQFLLGPGREVGSLFEVGDVARARTAFDVTREACLRCDEPRGRASLNGHRGATATAPDGEDR